MIKALFEKVERLRPAPRVSAHCDGPCGVYDPASARIAAEAVLSMTKKLLALELPDPSDKNAVVQYHNTFARYVAIKEEQAHLAKSELLVLWTDYFKPVHLEANPEIHEIFVRADRDLRAMLESTIRAGISAGEVPSGVDARALAIVVTALLRGVAMQWAIDARSIDVIAVKKEIRRLFELAFSRVAGDEV